MVKNISRHYDKEEIRSHADCIRYAAEILNAKVTDKRCAAVWRGGDGKDNVELSREKWHDFVTDDGGDIFDFACIAYYGKTKDTLRNDHVFFMEVIQHLGDWLKLTPLPEQKATPKREVKKSALQYKLEHGYTLKAKYEYRNADGSVEFCVFRLEHPKEKKTFLQCKVDANGEYVWNLDGIRRVPYNLPECLASDVVYIAEGEKDCDTLSAMGIAATTNNGGAEHWDPSFCDYFAGKDIVLLPDNDAKGKSHAERIIRDFRGKCKSMKCITISKLEKGDVTDWMQREGGSKELLMQTVAGAAPYKYADDRVQMAKEANATPFANFTETMVGDKSIKEPRHITSMVKDLHTRLLDAPFRCGSRLFDRDRDNGKIRYIEKNESLTAWISEKTNNNVRWDSKSLGAVTRSEFFQSVYEQAKQYNAISYIRDIYDRDDVFYCCEDLPDPSPDHAVFKRFCKFFCPANRESEIIIMTLFAAGLVYVYGENAPLFVIDAEQGQGTGKTVLVESAAELYNLHDDCVAPIRKTIHDLEQSNGDFMKEMLTTAARNSRYCLFDNITKTLKSEDLAQLVTAKNLTGRPAYAREEESRPNNLVYCATMNGAECNTDIASRAVFIDLTVPPDEEKADWHERLMAYMKENRNAIFADIRDIILHCPTTSVPIKTRYPRFERKVIRAFCKDDDEFIAVLNFLAKKQTDNNNDNSIGVLIDEILEKKIKQTEVLQGNTPFLQGENESVFVHADVVNLWFSQPILQQQIGDSNVSRIIRLLAKKGKVHNIIAKKKRFPDNSGGSMGIMYSKRYNANERPRVIAFDYIQNREKEVAR